MTAGTWLYPADTPTVIARKVAVTYRTHLRARVPDACDLVDDAMRSFGQLWIVSSIVTTEKDSLVSTAEAAELAGVEVGTVRKWRSRGVLDQDGQRRHLEVRGLDEHGWPMFIAGEVLEIVAATRARRRTA